MPKNYRAFLPESIVVTAENSSDRHQVGDEARSAWSGMESHTAEDRDREEGVPLADADCWLFPTC